jgi:anti-sigma factor RsiW
MGALSQSACKLGRSAAARLVEGVLVEACGRLEHGLEEAAILVVSGDLEHCPHVVQHLLHLSDTRLALLAQPHQLLDARVERREDVVAERDLCTRSPVRARCNVYRGPGPGAVAVIECGNGAGGVG